MTALFRAGDVVGFRPSSLDHIPGSWRKHAVGCAVRTLSQVVSVPVVEVRWRRGMPVGLTHVGGDLALICCARHSDCRDHFELGRSCASSSWTGTDSDYESLLANDRGSRWTPELRGTVWAPVWPDDFRIAAP